MAAGRYLKAFFGLFAAGLAAVALINLVVDPYASFHWRDIRGFNDQKHLKRGGGRVNKAVILSRYPFDLLFFGTSRAELGLDPNSPALGGVAAFNASQAGTNMTEIRIEALFAARHQTPRAIVIGLDFIAPPFTDDLSAAADFPDSPFAGRSLAPILLERLLSWHALVDCFTVIGHSVRHKPDPFTKFGYYDRTAVRSGIDHRKAFTQVLLEFLEPRSGYRGYVHRPERVTQLAEVVARYHAMGTRVLLFVSPVHAHQLEAMWDLGLFPAFEQWKRDLVAMAAQADHGEGAPVQVWDFSGYSSITAERIPEQSDARMRWYWESSHYTKDTGDLVLARLFSAEDRVGAVPADFGVRLSPDNVEAALASIRAGHDWYAKTFPDEVEAVRNLVRSTAPR